MDTDRPVIDLCMPWRFTPDPADEGTTLGFHLVSYDHSQWQQVDVPSVFETSNTVLETYSGVCWYRCMFDMSDSPERSIHYLKFDAVNYRSRIFLNGSLVAENHDGFLPFCIDITSNVQENGNTLAVEVDNRHYPGDVPGNHVGWRASGGIIGPVSVESCNAVAIRNFHIAAGHNGTFDLSLFIDNRSHQAQRPDISFSISNASSEASSEVLYTADLTDTNIAPEKSHSFTASGVIDHVVPWTPDNPMLYTLECECMVDGIALDRVTTTFGFRTIECSRGNLLLNGESIYLAGFNRHADSPHSGMAAETVITRADLEKMKHVGANCVRLCHYPHHQSELDICDELGLLTFCEIPLYFWNDKADGKQNQTARRITAERQLAAMIRRDRNHPSVIIWSVSNETNEYDNQIAQDNRDLILTARELDPTRLCVHVSNHWNTHPNFAEDDIICINGYPSMAWEDLSGASWPDAATAGARWRDGIEQLHSLHPDKPILVTEFGYVSFRGTIDGRFGEKTHSQVLEREYSGFDAPYVCGSLIWCWADHPWPPGRFLGGISTSPFGVVSRNRTAKRALQTAADLFSRRKK